MTIHYDSENLAQRSDSWGFWIFLVFALFGVFCLSLYYLVESKAFVFYDIGSDTYFCFYPLQLAVARQLHELHTVTWSFDLGLGGFLGSLFDPLWLITGWLPESWQLASRLPMFDLRVLLAGGFFYAYLREVGFRVPLSVIGGLGYAYSSYGMTNAQWEIMHGTEFVQLAAYLFLLERYLVRRGFWPAVFAGVVVGLGHPLGLYMLAFFSLIYGMIRLVLAKRDERKSLTRSLFVFAGWCTLGVVLTAPLLFPAIYYLLESPRVSGDHSVWHAALGSLLSHNDRLIISSEIAGFLGKDLLGTGSDYHGWGNYFEAPGFYAGILPLLCVPQLFGPSTTKRERLLCACGLLCVASYIVWPAVRYATYAFGHMSFRFSTLWISVLMLLLGLSGLRRALSTGWWLGGVVLGVAGILAVAFGGMITSPQSVNVEHSIRIAAFTLFYAGAAYASARMDINPSFLARILLPVVACELLMFAIPPVIERNAVNSDGSSPAGSYNDNTGKALNFIRQYDQDPDFYRVEKTFHSVFFDDALAQDYAGTQSYYFHASSITRFVDELGLARIYPSANYIGSMADRPAVLDLVGVKYLIAMDRDLDARPDMRFIATSSGLNIYKNETAQGVAHFYDAIAGESETDAVPQGPQRDVFVRDHVIVPDVQSVRTQLAALDSVPHAQSASAARAHLRKIRDDDLEGSLETASARVLLIAMPYDRGWKASLDGAALELFRADYGLTAALIPPGTHDLQLHYSPPGRRVGWWFTGAATLLLLAVSVWRRRRFVRMKFEPAATPG